MCPPAPVSVGQTTAIDNSSLPAPVARYELIPRFSRPPTVPTVSRSEAGRSPAPAPAPIDSPPTTVSGTAAPSYGPQPAAAGSVPLIPSSGLVGTAPPNLGYPSDSLSIDITGPLKTLVDVQFMSGGAIVNPMGCGVSDAQRSYCLGN